MSLPQLRPILKQLAMGRSRYLFGLDRVPDDRLNYSPGGDARSPLALADYHANFFRMVNYLITRRAFPTERPEIVPSASREEAKAKVDAAYGALIATVKELSEDDLRKTLPAPWGGELTVEEFLTAGVFVAGYTQGQLNYVQMCYGDTDANIPPGWGTEEP